MSLSSLDSPAVVSRLSEYRLVRANEIECLSPIPVNMGFIPIPFSWKVILAAFIEGHKIYSGFLTLCITFTFSIV